MIANLLNTLVGLGLAYAAIFPSTLTASRDRFGLIAAVVLIILALWARRSDLSTWQSLTWINEISTDRRLLLRCWNATGQSKH